MICIQRLHLKLVYFLMLAASLLAVPSRSVEAKEKIKCFSQIPTPNQSIEELNQVLNTAYNDAKTYFRKACRIDENDKNPEHAEAIKNSFKAKPNMSGLARIPIEDSAGRKTKDLLEKVLKRVRANHQVNKRLAEIIQNCDPGQSLATKAAESNENQKSICKQINEKLENSFPPLVKLARLHLALSYHSPTTSNFNQKAQTELNSTLDAQKSFKVAKWQPLSSDEIKDAESEFQKMKALAMASAAKNWDDTTTAQQKNETYTRELLKIRHIHYMIYLSFMGITPLLQFTKSENPARGEYSAAAKSVLESLSEEDRKLSQFEKDLQAPYVQGGRGYLHRSINSNLLRLLDYKTEVEEVLLEDPSFCGLGLSLHQAKVNHNISVAVASLPLMVISFFVPPAAAVTIGTGGALVYVAQSQYEKQISATRETSRVMRPGIDRLSILLERIEKDTPGGESVVAEIGQELQNDVTFLYRAQLQQAKESEANRDTAVIISPVILVSPLAVRYASIFKSQLIKMATASK